MNFQTSASPISKQHLIAAKELLSDPKKWVKTSSAVDKDGCNVLPTDPAACQFCMTGAIGHVMNVEYSSTIASRLFTQGLIEHFDNVWKFNDHPGTTHDKMLAYFDRLIERAPA